MRIPLIGLDVRVSRTPRVASDQGSIRSPEKTSLSTFGGTILDSDLLFAVRREPVAHRIVFMVAHDIFDKWFTVEDAREEGKDQDLNKKVQAALNEIDADNVFSEMAIYERLYGWAWSVRQTDIRYG